MNVFLASTHAGLKRFLEIRSRIPDAEIWVNGGVELNDLRTGQHGITKFNVTYDLTNSRDREIALGSIESHYEDCTIWIESLST